MFKKFISGIALFTMLLNPFFSLSSGIVRAEGEVYPIDAILDPNDVSPSFNTSRGIINSFEVSIPVDGNLTFKFFHLGSDGLNGLLDGDTDFTFVLSNQETVFPTQYGSFDYASDADLNGLHVDFFYQDIPSGKYNLEFTGPDAEFSLDYRIETVFEADMSYYYENRDVLNIYSVQQIVEEIDFSQEKLKVYEINMPFSGGVNIKGYGACSRVFLTTNYQHYYLNDIDAPVFDPDNSVLGVGEWKTESYFPYSADNLKPSYRKTSFDAGTYYLVVEKDDGGEARWNNIIHTLDDGYDCSAYQLKLVMDFTSNTLPSAHYFSLDRSAKDLSTDSGFLVGEVDLNRFGVEDQEYDFSINQPVRISMKSFASITTVVEILDDQRIPVASFVVGGQSYAQGLTPTELEKLSSITTFDTVLLEPGNYTIKFAGNFLQEYRQRIYDLYSGVSGLYDLMTITSPVGALKYLAKEIATDVAWQIADNLGKAHELGGGSFLVQYDIRPFSGQIDNSSFTPHNLNFLPNDIKQYLFEDHLWFAEDLALLWLYEGVTYDSYINNEFQPNRNLTRSEAARWLHATFFQKAYPAEGACIGLFYDVPAEPDCNAIEALHTLGVVNGVNGSDSFNPDGEINRAEFAQLVAKSMAIINNANDEYSPFINVPELPTCTESPFDDVAIDAWYCPAVQYLKSENILLGDEGLNTFRPSETINRAETATVLARVIDDVKAFLVGEYVYSDSQTVCADGAQVASVVDCTGSGDSSDTNQDTTNPSVPLTPCTENYASDLGGATSIFVEPQSFVMAQDEARLFSFNSGQGGLYDIWSDSQQAFMAQLIDDQGTVIDCDTEYSGVSDNFRVNADLIADTTYYLRVSTPEGGTLHLEWSYPQPTGPIGDGAEAVDHLDDLHIHDLQYPEVSDEGYQFWDAGHLLINDPKPFAIHENETAVFSFSLPYDATAMTVELPNMEGEHGTFLVRTKATKEFELSSEFSVTVGQYDPTARFGFNQLNAGVEYEMLITSGSGDIQSTAELSFTYDHAFETPGDDAPNQPLYNSAGRYPYTPARLLSGERFVNAYSFDSASDADVFMFEPSRYGLYSITMESSVDVQVQVFRNCHADEYDTERVFTIPANDSSEYPLILTEELGTYFCFKMHGSAGGYSFVLDQHSSVQDGDDYPETPVFLVTKDMQVSGTIDGNQDIDAFSIRTDVTRTFLLDGSLLVDIYNGDELLVSYANGLNGERAYVLKQGVDYMIKVQGAEGEAYFFTLKPGLANLSLHTPDAPRGNYGYEIQTYQKQNLYASQSDVNYGYYWYGNSGTLQPFQVAYFNDISIQYVGGVEDLILTAADSEGSLQLDILDGTGAVVQSGVPMFTANAWQAYPGVYGARYYRIQNLGSTAVDYTLSWKNFNNDTVKEYPIELGVRMQDAFDPPIHFGRGYQSQPTDLYYFTSDTTGPVLFEWSDKQRNAIYTIKLKDQYGQLMQTYDYAVDAFTFLAEQGEQYTLEIVPENANTYSNNTYLFALHAVDASEFTSQELAQLPVSPNFLPEIRLNDLTDIRSATPFVFDASQSTDVDGQIVSYNWMIDGIAYQGVEVVHTFANEGQYLVELHVIDNDAGQATVTQTVTVLPSVLPPVADFSPHIEPPYQGSTLLYLNASASYSPEGYQIVWWEWDVNSDGVRDDTGVQLGRYFGEGVHEITLTVRDDQGNEGSVTKTITIDPLPRDNFAETYDTAQPMYVYQYRNAELVSDMDRDYYQYIHQGGPGYVTFYTMGNTDTTCQRVNRYWHYYGYWAEQYYQYDDNGAGGVNCKVTLYAQYEGQRLNFLITKKAGTPNGVYTLRSYRGW